MPSRLAAFLLVLLAAAPLALAHSYSFDDLRVGHLWSPLPVEDDDATAVFGALLATGEKPITIVGGTSPDAERLRFRKLVDGVETWPETLVLEPGKPLGLAAWREHIWLSGLTRPLQEGDTVSLDLELSDGRHVTVESMVENAPTD